MTLPSAEFLDLQAALAGEYSLERELGRGGMGIVYLARDVQLDRLVAIKVLPAHLTVAADARERFLREARTAAGLSHPNIVPIHRVGQAGGFVYFVMSYVAGQTLGERLRTSGPLPPSDVMRIMREVSWALAYAHGHGVVHRDVKPDNILLEEGSGRALVTDFGIAHVDNLAPVTDPGRVMGTAHFMSPEQATNERLDGRSDLYSLGVVGYLAVSGRLPFEAPSVGALMMKQVSEGAPPVNVVAPGVPTALATAIDRCLSMEPEARFGSGETLADALAPISEGRPAVLPPLLRGWLRARNPAQGAYVVWTWMMTVGLAGEFAASFVFRGIDWRSMAYTASLAVAPLIPIIGYHVNQARRLFGAGFNLADLRTAIEVDERDRSEVTRLSPRSLTRSQAALRWGTYLSAASTTYMFSFWSTVDVRGPFGVLRSASFTATCILLAFSNMSDVPLLPAAARNVFRVGLRDRIWKSRHGAWLAKRLGAPTTSRPVGAGVFRATEAALGVAAGELFAALPPEYREQLASLPGTVAALESRAAEARAEVEQLEGLSQRAGADSIHVAARRDAARAQLAETVAALEGIRLDLLRLLAGSSDLAPLTTLLDAARVIGEDVSRLADAQREMEREAAPRRLGARRTPTPV